MPDPIDPPRGGAFSRHDLRNLKCPFFPRLRPFALILGSSRGLGNRGLAAALGVVLLSFTLGNPARAQWITQNLPLAPGFNPVFVQVTPATNDCDTVFASMPNIDSVWMYNRYTKTASSGLAPSATAVGQDHWLMWFPKRSAKSFLGTLSQIRAGQAYMIHVLDNSPATTLSLKGIPGLPRTDWIPLDMTLAGGPISEKSPVTFYQLFHDIPELTSDAGSSSSFYSIDPRVARETQIRNPLATTIVPGRAYWFILNGHRDNPYPFSVTALGEMNSVQFLKDGKTSSLVLANSLSTVSAKLHLALLDSETPPAGSPDLAGRVPVAALLVGPDGSYTPQLLAGGVDITLAPGETRTLRLGLATALLTPTSNSNATYQGLIEVTESAHGYRQLVPVVAEVPNSSLAKQNLSLLGTGARLRSSSTATTSSDAPSSGLWVGKITLAAVNTPGFSPTNSSPDISQNPLSKVASPLDMRVLLHVDSNGVARVIQQACFAQFWNGSNYDTQLYHSATGLVRGATLTSRVSAPAWPRLPPTPMTGTLGSNLSGSLTVPYDDPVNPFVHIYHPDHNNYDETYTNKLGAGVESFNVTRNVTFYFGSTIDAGSFSPGVPPMQFTGTNGEYVTTTGFANTTAFTVQLWATIPTYVQNGATILLLTNSGTHAQFNLGFQGNSGQLVLSVGTNTTTPNATIATADTVPLARWFNLTVTYDGSYGQIYVDGALDGGAYLPNLANGGAGLNWDSAWLGNTATNFSPSMIGEVHDVVVRNQATSIQLVPQLLLTPEMYNPSSIVLRLQGQSAATNIVNLTGGAIQVNSSGPGLLDLSSAPSVPLWTYGTAQGTYFEVITGPRREPIALAGTFQLTRVSQDSNLR